MFGKSYGSDTSRHRSTLPETVPPSGTTSPQLGLGLARGVLDSVLKSRRLYALECLDLGPRSRSTRVDSRGSGAIA
jgi:hypothetical protein